MAKGIIKPAGAIVLGQTISPDVLWSVVELRAVGLQFIQVPYTPRFDLARNIAVKRFFDSDATHLILLKDGYIYPPTLVHAFVGAIEKSDGEIKIIGSYTWQNVEPFAPLFTLIDSAALDFNNAYPTQAMQPAAMMIAREVVESLSWPCFFYDHERYSEDMDTLFCERALAAGFQSYVHLDVKTPALGVVLVNEHIRAQYIEATGYRVNHGIMVTEEKISDRSEI